MVFAFAMLPGGFEQLYAGALAEAEFGRVFIELIYAEVMSRRIEEYIAGVLDSAGDVQIAVSQLLIVLRIYPAERCKPYCSYLVYLPVHWMVVPVFIIPSVSEGYRRAGLEGRAGRIAAPEARGYKAERFYPQAAHCIFQQLGRIVGRPVCNGKRLAGFDVHDDHGGTVDNILLFLICSAGYLLLFL